jgi:hypothetical protein
LRAAYPLILIAVMADIFARAPKYGIRWLS